jgi:hypothetical protein
MEGILRAIAVAVKKIRLRLSLYREGKTLNDVLEHPFVKEIRAWQDRYGLRTPSEQRGARAEAHPAERQVGRIALNSARCVSISNI